MGIFTEKIRGVVGRGILSSTEFISNRSNESSKEADADSEDRISFLPLGIAFGYALSRLYRLHGDEILRYLTTHEKDLLIIAGITGITARVLLGYSEFLGKEAIKNQTSKSEELKNKIWNGFSYSKKVAQKFLGSKSRS